MSKAIKIIIKINSVLLSNKKVAAFFLEFWYKKSLLNVTKLYNKQGHTIPYSEVLKGVLNTYFSLPFKVRPFLKTVVATTEVVKNTTPIVAEKKQRRNDKCKCNSGKKYKNCCLNKL
ncbi:hypothetical protein ACIVBQ_000570 [Tenacibaculum discolor]